MDQTNQMDQFFTRERANKGIRLPLFTPDNKKTEHWIEILGVDSDKFRKASVESNRDMVRIAAIESVEERSQEIDRSKRELISSLVSGWSFDAPCNLESVSRFFFEAPHIMDAVDRAASKRGLFLGEKSAS